MTMAKFAKEARRASRHPHDSVLEIIGDSARVPGGAARLVDFSALGASFTALRAFAMGEKIHARLRLLKEGVLEIEGTVVRIREKTNSTLYAVKFDSVRRRLPRPGPQRSGRELAAAARLPHSRSSLVQSSR